MKRAGWLNLEMLLSHNVPVQPLQPIFMINFSGELAIFNKEFKNLFSALTIRTQLIAANKFPDNKFIVVNIKIPSFENPQDNKAIKLAIRKTHSFIRWSLHD